MPTPEFGSFGQSDLLQVLLVEFQGRRLRMVWRQLMGKSVGRMHGSERPKRLVRGRAR